MLKAVTTYDHVSWVYGQMIDNRPDIYPPDPRVGIGRPNPTGYLPARTKDGQWIQLGNVVERLFRSMMHWLDMDFIYEDPRFKTAPRLDPEAVADLERIMLERVQQKTLDDWMGIFLGEAGNVAAEPYLTSEQALDHPQIIHNGNVQSVHVPGVGDTRQLGPMVNMSGTPGRTQGPAPALGQHTVEVLARLGGDTGDSRQRRKYLHAQASPGGGNAPGPGDGHQRPVGLRAGCRAWRPRDPHRSPRRRLGPGRHALDGAPDHGRLRGHLPGPQDDGGPGDHGQAGRQG